MIILIHSSKTMRPAASNAQKLPKPELLAKASELNTYLNTLSLGSIKKVMGVSEQLAVKTHSRMASWTTEPKRQIAAVDCFLGDIYSGLQVTRWKNKDREYAQQHLRILSGLYGILRPLDGIQAYRLEMGYRLPDEPYKSLYSYWGDDIVNSLNRDEPIINLAAIEYSKTVTPFVDQKRVVTPTFQTINPKGGKPTFVVVHAKIARGSFAAWMIRNRVEKVADLKKFNEIGYEYNGELSTPSSPAFICKEFGGIGLSMRLT